MTIWIIEDELRHLKEALEAIEQARIQAPGAIEVKNSSNWHWPPQLKVVAPDGVEKNDPQPLARLPDILILDLFEWGRTFRGKDVYEKLRETERSERNRANAFVIIWSNYWSDPASRDFVTEMREKDTRFIALETKSKTLLADAVKGCIERMEEEG